MGSNLLRVNASKQEGKKAGDALPHRFATFATRRRKHFVHCFGLALDDVSCPR
jgi:hypothetical protein